MKFIVVDFETWTQRGPAWDNLDDAQTAADEYNAEGELDRYWSVETMEEEDLP